MARIIICKECGEEGPHHALGMCKACYMCQWRKANPEYQRQWREANPEYYRQWYAAHLAGERERNRHWRKVNPDKVREQGRQYHEAHREERNEYARQWHKANLDRAHERNRRWRKANPDKVREKSRRRYACKLGATIGPVDEATIYERDGRMCVYCGATENLELDHIVPLSKGGAHCEDNLVVACRHCNASKHTKPLEEWLQTQPKALAWVM